jgi:hypothetical protein
MSTPEDDTTSPVIVDTPVTTDTSTPISQQEQSWIDHKFLFENEHVKVVGHNTVSISGPGIVKKILRPGYGEYPLPKATIDMHVIGKVQLSGEIFQNSRDPTVQTDYIARKQKEIFERQLFERRQKQDNDIAERRKGGADKAEIDAMKKTHLREEEEAAENHAKFVQGDNRQDLFWQPTSFQLGEKDAVRGLELAVATMKVGEVALITCRSEYAYSDLGIEDYIPDNATIEYEVELLDAQAGSVEIYPGVMKKYVKKGEGWSTPSYNTTCDIFIEGSFAIEDGQDEDDQEGVEKTLENQPNIKKMNGFTTKQFLKRTEHPIQCRIDDILLPEGLEECLKTMRRGEIAIFEISKNVLLGNGFEPKRHSYPLNIPPMPNMRDLNYDGGEKTDLVVFFYIEMVDLHHNVDIWAMKLNERIAESERIKEIANEFFRLGVQNNQIGPDVPPAYTKRGTIGYLNRAIQRYLHCLDLYDDFAEFYQRQCTYDMVSRVIAVQLACFNNLQIIYTKMKKHKEVEDNAAKALLLFMTPVDIYKHERIGGPTGMDLNVFTTTPAEAVDDSEEPLLAPTGANLPGNDTTHDNGPNDIDTDNEPIQKKEQLTKAVLIGKSFPKQTNTSNLYKTLYRRAQALLLLDDPTGAEQTLKLCKEIFQQKAEFLAWKDLVADDLERLQAGESGIEVPLYKDQPVLMHGIVPIKLVDEKDKDQEKLFPVNFETVNDDVKKEIDKLNLLVDKKLKAVQQRGKQAWAKAFQDE